MAQISGAGHQLHRAHRLFNAFSDTQCLIDEAWQPELGTSQLFMRARGSGSAF